ncbi:hypothetical protein Tco_0001148 [Tanacetum coccineum]
MSNYTQKYVVSYSSLLYGEEVSSPLLTWHLLTTRHLLATTPRGSTSVADMYQTLSSGSKLSPCSQYWPWIRCIALCLMKGLAALYLLRRLAAPYLLRRLVASYLLSRLAAPYLLRRLAAPYLLRGLAAPYLLRRLAAPCLLRRLAASYLLIGLATPIDLWQRV